MIKKTPQKRYKSNIIQSFIINNVTKHPKDITSLIVNEFGISRQAGGRHLRKLIDDGTLIAKGKTRDRQYFLKPIVDERFRLNITSDLQEHVVWRERVQPLLTNVPRNVLDICHYGFTEIFNNVLDHSESQEVFISITYNPVLISITVHDLGVGIFKKIKTAFKLDDERHAALELSKGKLTTDRERHTGEGLFFASRMFDEFEILSGYLFFSHNQIGGDWLLENQKKHNTGTRVVMEIDPHSKLTEEEVFNKFAPKESLTFSTTNVPVVLAMHGEEKLVSRSQAKRLLNRLNRFQKVILDFKGVDSIGQAFSDEVFRVFRNDHPDIELVWVNAGTMVEKMIKRVTGEIDTQEKLF